MRIGFLEDDHDQAKIIKLWLEDAGHACVHFDNSGDFLRSLKRDSYDLAIFDWLLPGDTDGLETLKQIRAESSYRLPVIFVTQQDQESDIVEALQHGADDYMIKPVRRAELLARMNAVIRRVGGNETPDEDQLVFDPYEIDLKANTISLSGEPVSLTNKEFDFAVFLFRHVGQIVSRDHLLESVWGTRATINTRTIDTHASRIRTKLQIRPENGWQLTSIYQHGYRLEPLT